MRDSVDQRQMRAHERPELHAWLARRQPVWLQGDLRYAKAFDEIAISRHYKTERCATLGEYADRMGYDAAQVRRWRDIGLVLRVEKRAEEHILDGRVSLENVPVLRKIYENPSYLQDGDDWLGLAAFLSRRSSRGGDCGSACAVASKR